MDISDWEMRALTKKAPKRPRVTLNQGQLRREKFFTGQALRQHRAGCWQAIQKSHLELMMENFQQF